MSNFKIQRGIEFLKIVLNELADPQVLKIEEHPALPHMWRRMQDIRFNSRREPFEYRSKHFPRMMKYLYLRHPDLPREFQEFTTDGMIFDLIADFVRQNVLAKTLEDTLQNPEAHEREYLFFAFKFFAAMEDALIEDLSMKQGIIVSAPAVLVEKEDSAFEALTREDGALEILTGNDLEERKKNKKTEITSWNPFGENSIDDMIQVCRKKGEMDVISHIQDGGFEIADFTETDDGLTKIVAENKETSQRIEVYTDNHGVPVHLIDTESPTKKQDFEGENWRDELTVMSARSGKNPDMLASKADETLRVGAPKSEQRHPKIGTGTLKVDPHALEDALGVKAGYTRSEFSSVPVRVSETEKLKTPRSTAPGTAHATFAPLPGPMRGIPRQIGATGVEEDALEETQEGAAGGVNPRQAHRQRLTESGEITGRRPNQPKKRQEQRAQTQKPKKKQKSSDENLVAKVAIGTGIASATAFTTSLLASLPT